MRWNIGMLISHLCIGLKICPAIVDHRFRLEESSSRSSCLCSLKGRNRTSEESWSGWGNAPKFAQSSSWSTASCFLFSGVSGILSMSLLLSIDFQSSLLLLNASEEGEGNSSPCSFTEFPVLSSIASSKDGSSEVGKSLGRLITSREKERWRRCCVDSVVDLPDAHHTWSLALGISKTSCSYWRCTKKCEHGTEKLENL